MGIKSGYASTRRSIFSAPDAVRFCGFTENRLKELGIVLTRRTIAGKEDMAEKYILAVV